MFTPRPFARRLAPILLAIAAACATSPERRVVVTIAPDSVRWLDSAGVPRVELRQAIRNAGESTLYLEGCPGPSLERLVGAEWQPAYRPPCAGALAPLFPLAAGESVTTDLRFLGRTGSVGGFLFDSLAGTYRVVGGVAWVPRPRTPADYLAPGVSASNSVVLIGPRTNEADHR